MSHKKNLIWSSYLSWKIIIMLLMWSYANYLKMYSYVEPWFKLTLNRFLVPAKRRFTHVLNAVFSALHKIYPLKLPLWYFPWDGTTFSGRVIENLVICWYSIAWGLKVSARQILIIYTLQKWARQQINRVPYFRKMKKAKIKCNYSFSQLWNRS